MIIALFFDNSQFSEAKALRSLPITTALYYSMEPEDANVLKEDYDITYYLNGGIPTSDLTYNYIIEELPLTLDIPENRDIISLAGIPKAVIRIRLQR